LICFHINAYDILLVSDVLISVYFVHLLFRIWWVGEVLRSCLSVCLSVCLFLCSCISKTQCPDFTKLSVHVTCAWLDSPTRAVPYTVYFRFYEWRHIFT